MVVSWLTSQFRARPKPQPKRGAPIASYTMGTDPTGLGGNARGDMGNSKAPFNRNPCSPQEIRSYRQTASECVRGTIRNRRAGALSWAAALRQLRGEVGRARELAEIDLALTTEEILPFFRSHAMILRGWALVGQGQGEEGIAQLREGARCLSRNRSRP
jgi:hypothetical protein